MAVFYITKHVLSYDPAILLLSIYSRTMKPVFRIFTQKTCTQKSTPTLFVVGKNWKHVLYFIIKVWYIHTMAYYPAINSNRLFIYATTWMNCNGIMLVKRPILKGYIPCDLFT